MVIVNLDRDGNSLEATHTGKPGQRIVHDEARRLAGLHRRHAASGGQRAGLEPVAAADSGGSRMAPG
jgi:hypothetical protein